MLPFLASCIASLITRILTHPIDTVKTRIQASNNPAGFFSTLADIVKTEGFLALYQGIGITIAFSLPGLSVYLYLYDIMILIFEQHGFERNWFIPATSSAIVAELVSGFFWTPMEIIKQRQQVGFVLLEEANEEEGLEINEEPSILEHLKFIFKVEGISGFLSGYWLSMAVFLPYSIVYFLIYENFKFYCQEVGYQISVPIIIVASGLAAAIAGLVSNVFDALKTQWQIQIHQQNSTVYDLVKKGGVSLFLKGATARIAWTVPSAILSFTIYEYFKELQLAS